MILLFYSVSSDKLKVIVPFVDIDRIVDYHYLNFLFVNYLYVFNGHDRKHVICNTIYTVLQKCYNFNILGPFASMLINSFSCRMTMILGGITLFVGFSASFFAVDNLNVILVTYGIIAGNSLHSIE
jgi:hypothetical protein